MQTWPRVDGPGHVSVCPVCPAPSAPTTPPASKDPLAPKAEPQRLRQLLTPEGRQPGELPDDLLEDLPEETRKLLTNKPIAKPSTGPLREELADSLRQQGYVISEDAHGVRIGGAPRSHVSGGLSASDVVRMAADLDGGPLPAEQRIRCPKCDAVVPRQAARCEWCGEAFPPPQPAG
jgi:hypothetical protein